MLNLPIEYEMVNEVMFSKSPVTRQQPCSHQLGVQWSSFAKVIFYYTQEETMFRTLLRLTQDCLYTHSKGYPQQGPCEFA